MRSHLRLGLTVPLLLAVPAAAQQGTMGGTSTTGTMGGAGTGGTMGGTGGTMGGQALGGSAQTRVLSEAIVPTLPDGPLAWTVLDLAGIKLNATVTSPAPGFLYANRGTAKATVAGKAVTLKQGEGLFVAQGAKVNLASGRGLWHSVLAKPNPAVPAGLEGAKVAFASPTLKDVPKAPGQLSFVLVDLPPGSQTAVHAHPGPEYIRVTRGNIQYQTGISATEALGVGAARALQADTAVQKRNPAAGTASFVSWFVVDPNKPFASDASFK